MPSILYANTYRQYTCSSSLLQPLWYLHIRELYSRVTQQKGSSPPESPYLLSAVHACLQVFCAWLPVFVRLAPPSRILPNWRHYVCAGRSLHYLRKHLFPSPLLLHACVFMSVCVPRLGVVWDSTSSFTCLGYRTSAPAFTTGEGMMRVDTTGGACPRPCMLARFVRIVSHTHCCVTSRGHAFNHTYMLHITIISVNPTTHANVACSI